MKKLVVSVAIGGVIAASAVVWFGCSKGDLDQFVDKAKNMASEGANVAGENLEAATEAMQGVAADAQGLAGSIDLSVGQPAQTSSCFANFVPQGAGRPTVLQLQSYRTAEQETYPAVFLRAQVQAASLNELADQVVEARLFVQPQADSPILFSEPASPVQLKIVSIDDKLLSAELVSAALRNTATGEEIAATGKFTAVLP